MYGWLADAVLVLHLAFIVFVALGGFLVLRWPRLAWVHVPVLVWGALIEFSGGTCPLTPLEVSLRQRAGEAGYAGGFIEHYLTPVIYPGGLTRGAQIALGVLVLIVNGAVYARLWARRRAETPPRPHP
jgi:hypothetical protein